MTVPGFCGRRSDPEPGANPPVTTDPNADLIGHTFPVDAGSVGIVVGSAPWNPQYVEVDTGAGLTARVAAQVRRRKELS